MTRERITPWLIAGGLAVLVAGALGYAIGTGSAKDGSDAAAAREQGYDSTYETTLQRVENKTRSQGRKSGLKRGRVAGEKTGLREGADIGAGYASVQIGKTEAEAAAAAQAAAEAELADRQANCGVLVRAPDSCPTSSEVAAYRAAIAAAREARQQPEGPVDEDG